MKLVIEVNSKYVSDPAKEGKINDHVMMTPAIGEEDYWIYRVMLSKSQAIIAFPKFGQIGIGFQKEKDWNTNLPATCNPKKIFAHIKHNKGRSTIKDSDCVKAITMIKKYIEQK